jgi:hypothetical protein
MTSSQVFEDVENPFTAYSLLDFDDGERGLLVLHDGSQAFLRRESPDGTLHVSSILNMYDAWDEDYFVRDVKVEFQLIPHGNLTHVERWKKAQEFRRPPLKHSVRGETPPVLAGQLQGKSPLPPHFSAVECDSPSALITAFYRESEVIAADLSNYAGRGMGFPYILRLVEFNGAATTARLRLPGTVGAAYKTNLLGEIVAPVSFTPVEGSDYPISECQITLQPHEIVTVYVDLEWGRKVPRNLDEHRSVWATVHRVGED